MLNNVSPSSGWNRTIDIAPLVSFRILYGLLGAFGLLWSMAKGDIHNRFIAANFFFSYEGWEWIPYLGDAWILPIYCIGIIAALAISLGVLYRLSVFSFGLSFSYLHSIDATNYINHYYLIWLFSLILLLVPANAAYSLDLRLGLTKGRQSIPAWMVDIFKLQIAIVYIFAGIAKLNSDWLLGAMPLKIWCLQHQDFPLLGPLFKWDIAHYAMSWGGAFYDLTIIFWLLWRKTRVGAYLFVLTFHLLTAAMFDIGLFPPLMICGSLIFFSPARHRWVLTRLFGPSDRGADRLPKQVFFSKYIVLPFLYLYFLIQLFLPIRHLFFTNENILFTQNYYRYGWRVMLVENEGLVTFHVIDSNSNRTWVLDADNLEAEGLLTPYQIKRMSVQPEHIRQFAHYLSDRYAAQYQIPRPIVRVDAFVALNGRVSRRLIDPELDLARVGAAGLR